MYLLPFTLLLFALTPSESLKEWLSDDMFIPANVGVAVYDMSEGKYIMEENSEKVLTVASTQKLLSTAIALNSFPSDHQFETQIGYTGTIKDGSLYGEIYIYPNYNPTLGSKRFNRNLSEIINVIKSWLRQNNLKVLRGVKVIDPTLTTETLPRTWIWEDIGNYYGANPAGTIINENILELEFKSGAPGEPTEIVKTTPNLPLLKITNRVTGSTDQRDQAYAFGGPYGRGMTVQGTIPANRKNFKVKASLQNPQMALAYMVFKALEKEGIIMKGRYGAWDQPKKKKVNMFGVVKSAPLRAIVKETNFKSVNILAENLLQNSYLASGSLIGQGEWAKKYLEDKLGVNVTGMRLKDGSGLSHFNAVSAKQLVEVLLSMKDIKAFTKSLPVAGESGTVRSFMKNAKINGSITCKSGSMQGVRSYAGYLKNTSGKQFSFAIVVNDADANEEKVKKKIEELLSYIGGL